MNLNELENKKKLDIEVKEDLPAEGVQYLYFKNCSWKVTDKGIEVIPLKDSNGDVYQGNLLDFESKLTPPLLRGLHKITKEDATDLEILTPHIGEYAINFTKEGEQCDMLQFLFNTCRIKSKPISEYEIDEIFYTSRHLLNKLTAIGYMLHRYRNNNIEKAVIAMDINMSGGTFSGRSGKSILGKLFQHLTPTVYISGKKKDLLEDPFLFEEVEETTQCIWIDDLRKDFDMQGLFPRLTGEFIVDKMGEYRQILPAHLSRKFYLTTNHKLKGEGNSYRERQIVLGFSDWYNDNHKPTDDFGRLLFKDWDYEQHNLCYNMAAMCLQLYFKYGIIEAPIQNKPTKESAL